MKSLTSCHFPASIASSNKGLFTHTAGFRLSFSLLLRHEAILKLGLRRTAQMERFSLVRIAHWAQAWLKWNILV